MTERTKYNTKHRPTIILALCAAAMAAMQCVQFDFNNPVDPANSGGNNHFNPNITYGSFTDSRDGRNYRTVIIGEQTWMAENLNFNASGSVCYANNTRNCATYGRLYNWAQAMDLTSSCNTRTCAGQVQSQHRGICPVGWRVPSDADWTALVNFVGSNAGTKLKSRTGWNSGGNGTDDFGFSALPGGYGWDWDAGFDDVGDWGFWWSATEYDASDALNRGMTEDSNSMSWNFDKKAVFQFSLRCLQY
jgi:uncharacterized protein (TIGR02145 family)